jgi:hypothetical protein
MDIAARIDLFNAESLNRRDAKKYPLGFVPLRLGVKKLFILRSLYLTT